jgi:hypothetical protein
LPNDLAPGAVRHRRDSSMARSNEICAGAGHVHSGKVPFGKFA